MKKMLIIIPLISMFAVKANGAGLEDLKAYGAKMANKMSNYLDEREAQDSGIEAKCFYDERAPEADSKEIIKYNLVKSRKSVPVTFKGDWEMKSYTEIRTQGRINETLLANFIEEGEYIEYPDPKAVFGEPGADEFYSTKCTNQQATNGELRGEYTETTERIVARNRFRNTESYYKYEGIIHQSCTYNAYSVAELKTEDELYEDQCRKLHSCKALQSSELKDYIIKKYNCGDYKLKKEIEQKSVKKLKKK